MSAEAPGWRGGSGAMFDTIAARYDLLNALTSFGLDRWWRRRLVAEVRAGVTAARARQTALGAPRGPYDTEANATANDANGAAPDEVLDVATGTGDVALRLLAGRPALRVVGLDPSPEMLRLAAHKARAGRQGARVDWVHGTAEALPFCDARFASSCISFGIRNVPDRAAGLREMLRVTRPGGRVCVLELGEPRGRILGPLARLHVHRVVPWVGALLSGGGAYRYLERSIAAFPPPEAFVDSMQRAGLARVRCRPLSFGAVHLFVGEVP